MKLIQIWANSTLIVHTVSILRPTVHYGVGLQGSPATALSRSARSAARFACMLFYLVIVTFFYSCQADQYEVQQVQRDTQKVHILILKE